MVLKEKAMNKSSNLALYYYLSCQWIGYSLAGGSAPKSPFAYFLVAAPLPGPPLVH